MYFKMTYPKTDEGVRIEPVMIPKKCPESLRITTERLQGQRSLVVFKKQMGCRWVLLGKKNYLYKVLINMLQRGEHRGTSFC